MKLDIGDHEWLIIPGYDDPKTGIFHGGYWWCSRCTGKGGSNRLPKSMLPVGPCPGRLTPSVDPVTTGS